MRNLRLLSIVCLLFFSSSLSYAATIIRPKVTTTSGGVSYQTPALVQCASNYGSTVTLTGVTNGNFLVATSSGFPSVEDVGVSTTSGSTTSWTAAFISGTGGSTAKIFYAWATATGNIEITGTASSDVGVSLHEYSGIAASSPLIGASTPGIGDGTNFASGSVTATQTHVLLVAITFNSYNTYSHTPETLNPAWNSRTSEPNHVHYTWDRILTNASGDYTFSGTTDDGSTFAFVMFKAAQQ
jgi:hypothetical protein